VMALNNDPAALRRRLMTELRRTRLAAGKTQREVADALDWSASKVIRIEAGQVAISTTDLKALLGYYGASDQKRTDELVKMAQGSKKQPWTQYKDLLSQDSIRYLGYASSCSIFRQFDADVVPGLLQTEEYTRALNYGAYGSMVSELDRLVEFRQEMQDVILDSATPRKFSFIIDEGVIRRAVGGRRIMTRQLEKLSVLARRPDVKIQVVPFSVGAQPGMRGPFTLMEFFSAEDHDVLYVEDTTGSITLTEDPEATSLHLQTFLGLEQISSPPGELDPFLERAIERLPTEDVEEPLRADGDQATSR
jgi:transcriptional regulator with XRE-family HTH domain